MKKLCLLILPIMLLAGCSAAKKEIEVEEVEPKIVEPENGKLAIEWCVEALQKSNQIDLYTYQEVPNEVAKSWPYWNDPENNNIFVYTFDTYRNTKKTEYICHLEAKKGEYEFKIPPECILEGFPVIYLVS